MTAVDAKIPRVKIARYTIGSGGQTTTFNTNGFEMFFVMQMYRDTGERSQDGYGLIKFVNNTPYLVRISGMSGFSVDSYDSTTHLLTFTHPGYTNVELIGYA